MDVVLAEGKYQEQHDTRVMEVLKQTEAVKLTLKPATCKCESSKQNVLGIAAAKKGSEQTLQRAAMYRMKPHYSVAGLRKFMGKVGKFFSRS
jgi:hypothetical protein